MTPAQGTARAGFNAICPSCGKAIVNAVPSPENTIRCGACNSTFVIKQREPQAPPVPPPEELDNLTPSINAACPNCGLLIANAIISADDTVQCKACKNVFVVKIRRRTTTSGRMVKEAVNEDATEVSQDREPAEEVPPEPEVDQELIETGSYDPAQIAAIAYDRPERVPLGPVPEIISYRLLLIVACSALALAIISSLWRLYAAAHQEPPPVTELGFAFSPVLVALIGGASRILVAVLLLRGVGYVARLDERAEWIVWRSAALTTPLSEPSGSNLPFILPWSISGGLLIGLGLVMAGREASRALLSLSGGSGAIIGAGLLLAVLGLGSGEARRFLWRMGQFGKALPQRKRGDEVGLAPPVRVQAFDQTSSAGLMLLALAFLAAGFATFIWLMYEDLKLIFELALVGVSFLGIVGGAYTFYRLAALWSEMLHGWELGARSIGKPRSSYGGELSMRAFRAGAWTISACIVVLIVPVVKTLGNSSVPLTLLNIFLPASGILFFLWLAAVKTDSFRMALATAVVAGPRSFEVKRSSVVRAVAAALFVFVALAGLAALLQIFADVGQLWRVSVATATSGAAARALLMGVLEFGLVVLPPCWVALLILDLDRATANLETCSELGTY